MKNEDSFSFHFSLTENKNTDRLSFGIMIMNKYAVSLLFVTYIFSITSCVSLQDKEIPINERAELNIIGSVSTSFHSFQFLNFVISKEVLKSKAYEGLKKEAQKKFSGNIDVINIYINGKFSGLEFINIASYAGGMLAFSADPKIELLPIVAIPFLIGNFQKINATGDVILLDAKTGETLSIRNKIMALLPKINEDIIEKVPTGSRIAILSISSNDSSLAENVIDDLELNLVASRKFIVVDRRSVDAIRQEQNFQMSLDVSDDSAVSIGQMIGANVVIVGIITTTATRGRVTVRALNVETGQVIAIASEQF